MPSDTAGSGQQAAAAGGDSAPGAQHSEEELAQAELLLRGAQPPHAPPDVNVAERAAEAQLLPQVALQRGLNAERQHGIALQDGCHGQVVGDQGFQVRLQ